MLNSTQLTQTQDWISSVLGNHRAPIGSELNRMLTKTDSWTLEVFSQYPLSRQLEILKENKEHAFTGTSAMTGKQFTISAFTKPTIALLDALIEEQRKVEETVETIEINTILDSRPSFS